MRSEANFSLRSVGLCAAALLSACTFTRGQVDDCQSTSECREAFGVGSVCGESGFCEQVPEQPRCATAWPVDFDANPSAYPGLILIGTIIDGTLETHQARAQSVELAVRDANEAGGIDGRSFGLVVCSNEETAAIDTLNQDEASLATADHLATIGAVAIVGPPSSSAAERVFMMSDQQLLLVSPSASGTDLTALEPDASDESPGRLWRTTAPDAEQAARIVADLTSRSVSNLAIVHSNDLYGTGIAEAVQDGLPGSVTAEAFAYDSEGRLSEIQADVGRGEAEEILLISSRTEEITGFLRSAAENTRYDGRTFFLTDAAANRDLVTGIMTQPALFDRIRGTRPSLPDAVTLDAFLSRYNMTFGEDASDLSFTSNSYDAAWLTLYAIAWAVLQEGGTFNAATLGRGMRKVSAGESVPIRMSAWTTVQTAFQAGESVDVIGSSGNLDFDSVTEEISADFELWGVDGTGIISL